MRNYVTIEVGGKAVGVYDTEKKQYEKLVQRNRHRFWKLDAYGIQVSILENLKEKGCESVEIFESDTQTTYVSRFEDWLDAPIEEHKEHGAQRFLTMKKMQVTKKKGQAESYH